MRALILTGFLGFATLTGCAFPGVFKLNIQQGNIVTPEMLDQLEKGMTPKQVQFVMGLPVLRQPFNSNRWEYVYTLEKRDQIVEQYHITIHFDSTGRYSHYTGELPERMNDAENSKAQLEEDEAGKESKTAQTIDD